MNDRKSRAWNPNDARRRHGYSMQRRPNFRSTAFRAAPVDKSEQRHEEERFGITGNQKKGGGVSKDRQRAEDLKCRREVPALTKQKEVSPESPCSDLRGDEKRIVALEIKDATKQAGDRWISGKESDIGNFHHLVIDRRHGRLVTANVDVHEPVTVVLYKRGISMRKRSLRREKTNRVCDLRQRQNQAGHQRFNCRSYRSHSGKKRNRRGDTKGLRIARTCLGLAWSSFQSHLSRWMVFDGLDWTGAPRVYSVGRERQPKIANRLRGRFVGGVD